jgi:hypothetical protein
MAIMMITDVNDASLRDIVLIFKEPVATEAHGKHGIFMDNFCVFRGFRGYLSRFRLKSVPFITDVLDATITMTGRTLA